MDRALRRHGTHAECMQHLVCLVIADASMEQVSMGACAGAGAWLLWEGAANLLWTGAALQSAQSPPLLTMHPCESVRVLARQPEQRILRANRLLEPHTLTR